MLVVEPGTLSRPPRQAAELSNNGNHIMVNEILEGNELSIIRALEQIHDARPNLFMKAQEKIRRESLRSRKASSSKALASLRAPAPTNGQEEAGTFVPTDQPDSARRMMEDAGLQAGDDHPPPQGTAEVNAPTVQFSAPMYFGMEGEPSVTVAVMRIGNLDCTTLVRFRTDDVTATAGKVYEGTFGDLEFKPGENKKKVEIPLLNDDEWHTTTEFRVALQGLQMASLGRFLWQCRVKVIDDDTFPTSRFREKLKMHKEDLVPPMQLLWEFCRMQLQDPVVLTNSIVFVISGLITNILFCLKMLSTMYLLDFILTDNADDERSVLEALDQALGKTFALKIIIAIILFDMGVGHLIDYIMFSYFPIAGRSRKTLQSALVRKFLNFDDEARMAFPEADLVMALVRDIPEVVTGYMHTLGLVRDISMLMLIVLLNLLKPMLHGHPPSFTAALLTVIFPVTLMPIIALRDGIYKTYLAKQFHHQNRFIDFVDYTVSIIRLIVDYSKRAKYVTDLEYRIDKFNTATIDSTTVLMNNNSFAGWVLAILSSLYIWVAALMVIDGRLTIGTFVANYGILQKIGSDWQGIYKLILEIHSCIPALMRITHYLNLTTDIPLRMTLAKVNEDFAAEEFKDVVSPDLLMIRFKSQLIEGQDRSMDDNERQDRLNERQERNSWDGDITIEQGKLVAFVGPRGGGKSTVLRLLGGAVLPWDTKAMMIYIPLHLRVLHVSVEPLFIKGTLKENLMFGVTPKDSDSREERVRAICKRLGMNDKLMDLFDKEEKWDTRLSQVEAKEIMLARALIANYHVLCIHRPTMGFSDQASENVMNLLREFVEKKGVLQDTATFDSRRPRTCIITSSKIVGVQGADEVYKVDQHKIRKWDYTKSTSLVEMGLEG